MKTLTLSFYFLICLSIYSYAQKIKTPFSSENLFGNVKQVTEILLSPRKRIKIDTIEKIISDYDITGNIIRKLVFPRINGSSSASRQYNYTTNYDSQGKRQSIDMSSQLDKEIFKFDLNDNITRSIFYYKNDSLIRRLYKYDNKGNQKEYIFEDLQTGSVPNATIAYRRKFDNNGNVIEEDLYNNGKLDNQAYFVHKAFDMAKNWTKRSCYIIKNGNKTEGVTYIRQFIYY